MKFMPMIVCDDVEATSRWYQNLFALESAHGGPDYEQLVYDGNVVLQLHREDVNEHPFLAKADSGSTGNGILLWFETDSFDDVVDRIKRSSVNVLDGPLTNEKANHREVWIRDVNGCMVVVSSPYGDC